MRQRSLPATFISLPLVSASYERADEETPFCICFKKKCCKKYKKPGKKYCKNCPKKEKH